ncbi:XTP/dITP diphosphatase [Geomicrobium sediminis]|uniref:dITP/XTP pyrophosphatase n=1 Tax=Geomicrobium sediminis TaxID=1347788 RepID=A0ABS2PA78_9BACL|nr:XTP/dITP diphosphatase [Geomicrobium sediminis]MBM7631753.1 XTP/dITP diphosphohydrolase [Geomicrobium sediminis]
MTTIVLATKNEGKRKELETMLQGKVDVKSLNDYPECPDVEETGTTFYENAKLKAEFVSNYTKLPALADDSGLEVDALDGAPGVYSARFAGEPKSDARNNEKLLDMLKEVDDADRTARFICALVYFDASTGKEQAVEGTCEGRILTEAQGEHGFGYDPLMYSPEHGKSLAEMTPDEKNAISHRSHALKKMDELWSTL